MSRLPLLLALLLPSCSALRGGGEGSLPPLERFEASEVHMGTLFRILLYAPERGAAERAFAAAFERIARLDGMLSDYDTRSELNGLAASGDRTEPELAVVSPELFEVLRLSQELAEATGGAFDVTAGTVFRLWRRAARRGQPPEEAEVRDALAHAGYERLELDHGRRAVRVRGPGLRLDLGGIAKGFAADEVLALLRALGFPCCLVDAGGDLALGAAPPGRAGWRVEIAGVREGERCHLVLAQAGIATSGDLERFFEVDGRRYSHLVDPRIGLASTERRLVTVTGPTGVLADALASALSIVGEAEAVELLRRYGASARVLTLREPQPVVWTGGAFEGALSCRSIHDHDPGHQPSDRP